MWFSRELAGGRVTFDGVRSGRRVGLAVIAIAMLSLTLCALASATTGHNFTGQIGELGTGDGQFSEPNGRGPSGIAAMPSTGDLFALDAGQNGPGPRVQRFNAAGEFQSRFLIEPVYNTVGSIAADPTGGGAVYVSANRDPAVAAVVKYSAGGVFAYELDASTSGTTLNNPIFGAAPIAVDPTNGVVYVAATDGAGAPVVDSFDGATGAFVASFSGSSGSPDGGFQCVSALAVDAAHNVYVLDPCKGRVDQYSAAGAFGATLDSAAPSAVAVDPVSGEIYVSEGGQSGLQVTQFPAGGGGSGYTFDASIVGGIRAMAVDGSGTVYTADATAPVVERFTAFAGPTVTTEPATLVDTRAATLNGSVNPEGVSTAAYFEYGTDSTYGSRTPDVDVGGGTTDVSATAAIDQLEPNRTYYYRLVGSTSAGSIVGPEQTFSTIAAPATPGDESFASAITPTSARLHGTVNPNNSNFTFWHFEYGTTAAYGSATPPVLQFGGGALDLPLVSSVLDLIPNTVYHFRMVADNLIGGLQAGADQTLVTAPAAGANATDITTQRARLTGVVNPHGAQTTYHFRYGPTQAYGATTPEVDAGSQDGERTVDQLVTGLAPSTTYHVQVVATTDGITRSGADGTFITSARPIATAIDAIDVSSESATVVGTADTHGLAGRYWFELSSLDGRYAGTTGVQQVPSGPDAQRVTATVGGLPAGETLVARMILESNDATDYSDQISFGTAAGSGTIPPPAPPVSYGCLTPHLNAYNAKAKPGEAIVITGSDLGVGGTAVLGAEQITPTDWAANKLTVHVPADADRTLPLTINCGRVSNTIAVGVAQGKANAVSAVRRVVAGRRATLTIKVAGPGKLEVGSSRTTTASKTIKKAGSYKIKLMLNTAGSRLLKKARSRRLTVNVRIRFTPVEGQANTTTSVLHFSRKASR